MIKELFLIVEGFNSSGGIRVLTCICNVAAKAGIKVSIICPGYSPKPFYPINEKVNIISFSAVRGLRMFRFLFEICRLRWLSDGLFVTGNYRLISLIDLIGRLSGRQKPLFIIQGVDRISLIEQATHSEIVKKINRIFLYFSHRVQCHRVYVSHYLKSNYGKPGLIIPNYVGTKFLSNPNHDKLRNSNVIRIGFTSTLAPNKGFQFYLEVFKFIRIDPEFAGLNIEFICATQDNDLIKNYFNSGILFVCPSADEGMHEFYCSCHIFASLSISEGFGLPALEAMASGCAVICSNSGGVSDFVVDGKTGLLLSERTVTAVVEAMRLLIFNKEKRNTIASTGKLHANNFNYGKFRDNYLRLFQELS